MINVFHRFFFAVKLLSHFPLKHRQHLVRYCCVGCMGQAFSTSLELTNYISMDPNDSSFSIPHLSVLSCTKKYLPSAIRLCSSSLSSTHPPPPHPLFSFLWRRVAVGPFITQLGSCHWWKLTREENLWVRLASISISWTRLAGAITTFLCTSISLSINDGSSINIESYF